MWYRSPETGAGTGGEATSPAPAGSPSSPSPTPAADGGGTAAPSTDPFAIVAGQKPAGLADKFWNAELKQIRLPELMRSYSEAESLIGRRAEQMSTSDWQRMVETRVAGMTKELEAKAIQNIRGQAPKEAKDYQIQLSPDALKGLPEPMQNLAQYESDPLVGWFRNFAHEAGLGQGQFQQAFEGYLSTMAQASRQSALSEQSKLGDNGPKRMEALSRWLDANLEARQAKALRDSLTSADAFAAVENLQQKFKDPSLIRGFADAGDMGRVGPGLSTQEEIRAAQRDPRYWDPNRRDNAFVRAIDAAWQRLYNNQQNGRGG